MTTLAWITIGVGVAGLIVCAWAAGVRVKATLKRKDDE